MKATWNGTVLAESDATVVVEGNQYFPAESMNREYFQPSETHTVCGWKGTASYYDIVVDGDTNKDAAWYYPEAKSDAKISRAMSRFGRVWKSDRKLAADLCG